MVYSTPTVSKKRRIVAGALLLAMVSTSTTDAFTTQQQQTTQSRVFAAPQHLQLHAMNNHHNDDDSSLSSLLENAGKFLTTAAATAGLAASLLLLPNTAFAEDELAAKYGGGFDSSLVDQTCLVDKCSLQAKSCLADDPSCRKGLTCTAKCLGDNSCITGCMARYGNKNLDNLLKCTIEDNECIKVAILPGGADPLGQEPRGPAPTVKNFDLKTLEGTWYKVAGFNPNYDCYACQRNTFAAPSNSNPLFVSNDKLNMDVEFSMPHLLPDGSPPPPKNVRETVNGPNDEGVMVGSQSIAFNDYETHELMVFDGAKNSNHNNPLTNLVLQKGSDNEASYSRTAHSEGEMFGLKFWENWYIIGENDANEPEFKFVYYNGKTRQNTYEGAFVYSRTRELSPESMAKVYGIAQTAGMNPDQFCKIRNGCFTDEQAPAATSNGNSNGPFQSILASTKVSQLLGVEPVAAENISKRKPIAAELLNQPAEASNRAWWYEVGDYLENPHRHFKAMDSLRTTMEWPEEVVQQNSKQQQEQQQQ